MKKTFLFLVLCAVNLSFAKSELATYQVRFINLWNSADHLGFPGNAHFSDIVVGTHKPNFHLFKIGELSDPAFELLAELGQTNRLKRKLNQAKRNGVVENIQIVPAFYPTGKGEEIEFEVEVSKDFPLLSFATMIAPSPDWIVGLDSVQVTLGGAFIDGLEIDLYAIDAGTEEGDYPGNFSLQNEASRPLSRIGLLPCLPGFDKPFARLSLKKL